MQEPITGGNAEGLLVDLLMAVMDSPAVWTDAAGDPAAGMAWRDAVTDRMAASRVYASYEALVTECAHEMGLPPIATQRLFDRWAGMRPRLDAAALHRLPVPFGFVTNCSASLASSVASRSGLHPRFTLSAEEAGWYKPDPRIYVEACRRLGTEPRRTLFVAGARYDADGAHAAGLRAVMVVRRLDQPVPDPPIRVVQSLDELVAAGD